MQLHEVLDPKYAGLGYDVQTRTLAVVTKDGRTYEYWPVELKAYWHALASASLTYFLSGADEICARIK